MNEASQFEIQFQEFSSHQLFAHLFQACNILRGPVSQDEYKSYLTPILFFKRISDVYDEEFSDALNASGGDSEYASLSEHHRFTIPEGCHWNDVRNHESNIGEAIVKAMSGIERANPEHLRGVFSSFDEAVWTDKTKLTDERLKDLIEHMSKIKVGNKNYASDVMGDSYEYLIKKFADISKRTAGEFYTPRTIVKLLIMLLNPKPNETVYDPACGTGGILIEAIRHINNEKMTYGKIYGQENNLANSAIARMNLFLHGAKEFTITQGDTLRAPNYHEGGKLKTFDCVAANPPFALKNWGADMFAEDPYGRCIWGCPADTNGDFAWLQHMYMSMKPETGRCAVVLPQGVLFRSGKEGDIRRQLIESRTLECIITLSGGIFYSTGVSVCIIFMTNHKEESHKGKVCMIDASDICTPLRAQNSMSEDDIMRVYEMYRDYKNVNGYCRIVSLPEIRGRDYTLAVNNYIVNHEDNELSASDIRRKYFDALNRTRELEDRIKRLILEGGFLNENN